MLLKDQILDDTKVAMKNKDAHRLSVLRFLNSSIKNKEIEVRPNDLTDKDVIAVVKKLVKQRKDAIGQFESANRDDLVQKEKAELIILQHYLPESMSTAELQKIVTDVIGELKASSIKDMGAVMKQVMGRTQGQADGSQVSQMVKSQLAGMVCED